MCRSLLSNTELLGVYYLNIFQYTILVAQLLKLKAIFQVNTEVMGMPSVYLGDFKIFPKTVMTNIHLIIVQYIV